MLSNTLGKYYNNYLLIDNNAHIVGHNVEDSREYFLHYVLLLLLLLFKVEIPCSIIYNTTKISYKMITLTWYKSFKLNIIKTNKIIINIKIRRTYYVVFTS